MDIDKYRISRVLTIGADYTAIALKKNIISEIPPPFFTPLNFLESYGIKREDLQEWVISVPMYLIEKNKFMHEFYEIQAKFLLECVNRINSNEKIVIYESTSSASQVITEFSMNHASVVSLFLPLSSEEDDIARLRFNWGVIPCQIT